MAAGWKRDRPSRIEKLADAIGALGARDEVLIAERRRIDEARQAGAQELYRLCGSFANQVNDLLRRVEVVLDPGEFHLGQYAEYGDTIFQLSVRGRVVLLCFTSPEEMVSTENFRQPYVLEGTTRCFNQQLLEQANVEENLMFCCTGAGWQYFHPRTHQQGPFDEDYLVSLFEALL